MGETVPTFLMGGESIVEVAFTEWEEGPDGWDMTVGESVDLRGQWIDRIVFEMPVGCYEMYVAANGKVTMVPGRHGTPLKRCRRHTLTDEDSAMNVLDVRQ